MKIVEAGELLSRESRRELEEVARLADVCRGYLERHGRLPNATGRDLLDAIDRLLGRRA